MAAILNFITSLCISASSVPMNYFYMLQLFFGDFLYIHLCIWAFKHFMELVHAYSFWVNRVEINNDDDVINTDVVD